MGLYKEKKFKHKFVKLIFLLKRHSEVPIQGTSATLKGALSQRNSPPLTLLIDIYRLI